MNLRAFCLATTCLVAMAPAAAQAQDTSATQQGSTAAASPVTPDTADDPGQDARNATGQSEDGLAAQQRSAAQQRADVIAGTPPQEAGPSGDVVVTGSRIIRPNAHSAAPVQTTTAFEIQQQGAINIEDVLNRLSQVQPDNQQTYGDSDGKQRVALRALGFNRTLSLIDGLRLGQTEAIDLNVIPVSLVERVDVLSGGASSVYGSDAIAGVINFILKKNYKGLQIDTNYAFYNHENEETLTSPVARSYGFPTPTGNSTFGPRYDITATAGHSFFDDKVNISVFGSYRSGTAFTYDSIDYAACELLPTGTAGNGPLACQVSTRSPYGYITPLGAGRPTTPLVDSRDGSRTFVPYDQSYGNNFFDGYYFGRQYDRINTGAFLNAHLSNAFEAYGTFIYTHDKSYNQFSQPSIYSNANYAGAPPYLVNCNNPFLSAQQAGILCGAAAGTSALAPFNLTYRFSGAQGPRDQYVNTGYRGTLGFRGEIAPDIHYDIAGVYARNDNVETVGLALADQAKINRALNVVNVSGVPTCQSVVDGTDPACVPLDVFQANVTDPALLNYLFAGNTGTRSNLGQLYDVVGTLNVDFTRFGIKSPLANQGLAIAVGGEYRQDEQRNTATDLYRNENGGSDYSYKQHVSEANIEAQLPLLEESRFSYLLQVNGGYRLSKYSTNSRTFNTWKVEGLWSPIRDFTLRVSRNRAARAPTVYEANPSTSFTQSGSNDPCATTLAGRGPTYSLEACRATGLPDNLYGSTALDCTVGGASGCNARYGGFSIVPETGNTLTYGVVLQPRFLPGFTASVDRYEINIVNSIGYDYETFAIDGCGVTLDPYYCSRFVRNADGTLYGPTPTGTTTGFITAGTANLYRNKTAGIDFQGQYSVAVAPLGGRFDFLFNGTRQTYFGGKDTVATVYPKNCVGYYGPRCGEPRPKWVTSLRGTYTTTDGFFSTSLNWRYIGPTSLTNNSDQPGIGFTDADRRDQFTRFAPYSYFDVSVNFAVQKRMSLRLSVNNLFDKDPPLYARTYGSVGLSHSNTVPQRYDPFGRNISVGVSTRF